MKRRVSIFSFYREPRTLRRDITKFAEHGLGASYRYLGYDGVARNSDRVSISFIRARRGLFREEQVK